jgi:hypothetical protein
MPVLVIDGEIRGRKSEFKAPGSCEWCGRYVTAVECGTVTAIFDGERPTGTERVTVLTRLCAECVDAYSLLGRDGLIE